MASSSDGGEILEIKKALKVWENDFKATNNRKPGREDMAAAPQDIQELYRKYSRLKKGPKPSLDNSVNEKSSNGYESNHYESKEKESTTDSGRDVSGKAVDVWGAHLNKKKVSDKEDDKASEKEREKPEPKESALRMYSKKLFNNSNESSQIFRGPRQGRPSSKKQDFWSREEQSSGTSASSLDTFNKQGPETSSINSDSKDLQETAPVLEFFGTKLNTKAIKVGSQMKGRASIDPSRVVRAALPKRKRHSLQEDWLSKCEKENAVKSFAGDGDVFREPVEENGTRRTDSHVGAKKKRSPKTRKNRVFDSSGDEDDSVKESPKKGSRNVSMHNGHPASRKDDVFTCIVTKSDIENTKKDLPKNIYKTGSDIQSKEVNTHFTEDHPPFTDDQTHFTEDHTHFTDDTDSARETQNFKDTIHSHPFHTGDNQDENLESRTGEGKGHTKRFIDSPTQPPSKKRKANYDSVTSLEDRADSEKMGVERDEDLDDEDDDSPVKVKKRKVTGAGGVSAPKRNLNENFVRLNMLTKSYKRRGKGGMRGEAYKRMMWKQKTGAGGARRGGGRGRAGFRPRGMSEGTDKCFKCGGTGHWASKCTGQNSVKKQCEEEPEDPEAVMGPLPTLEEAALAAAGAKPQPGNLTDEGRGDRFEPLSIATPVFETAIAARSIEPLFQPTEDGVPDVTPKAVYKALKTMGYETFRPGQEQAMMRILSGLSTLVVLSTGAGKSLCYQLPAYMYNQRSPSITLVISPLVSLMDDQVLGLPRCLKGARLHSHMTKPQREKVHAELQAGKIQILLVSPEAVVGGGRNCLPHPSKMPPIAFACVDEAHCISEWSHNFRPSYLMLCKVLKERLGVHCILALTATATRTTSDSVAHHLGIADQPGAVIRGCSVPTNLQLSVSKDLDRERALIDLLKGDRFRRLKSIIVYCIRRDETERIASLIRTCLQSEPFYSDDDDDEGEDDEGGKMEVEEENLEDKKKGKKGRKKEESKKSSYQKKMRGKKNQKPVKLEANSCEAYHAGKSPTERRRVQNQFMSGNLRIVVATVAFGMGLDKADVRAVIHFNLPRTFESFVQEIGRAGRDGLPAHCHIFLDKTGSDVCELRRHTYGNSVDRFTIKKLVRRIFNPCKCNQIHKLKEANEVDPEGHTSVNVCPGHACSLQVEPTVQDLDIKEEGIATLMCYLELHQDRWLVTSPHTYTTCTLNFYGGPRELRECALKSPAVGAALARERISGKKGAKDDGKTSLVFDVVELASAMGWELTPVKRELRQLQWKQDKIKGWVRTGVMVEFSDLAFSFRCRGNLSNAEMDGVVDFLYQRVMLLEQRELGQLHAIYSTLESVSKSTYMDCCDEVDVKKSDHLRGELSKYFTEELDLSKIQTNKEDKSKVDLAEEGRIRMNVRQFISVNHDRTFSGRAIARILQGIASPCFPAQVWGRDRRFWRSHVEADFRTIIRIANEEVMRMR